MPVNFSFSLGHHLGLPALPYWAAMQLALAKALAKAKEKAPGIRGTRRRADGVGGLAPTP